MSTDWRALCEEMADGLASTGEAASGTYKALLDRARAALAAEPVAEGPTPSDEELLKLARAELNNSPNWEEPEYDASNPFPYEAPGIAWLNFARAVLARYGHQPAPPADGEDKAPAVTEVIAWLRTEAEIDDGFELTQSAAYQRRAAELLERQAAPVPVAVGERLPQAENRDAEGRR